MEKLIIFLKALSWIFGIISTLVFLGALYLNIKYSGSVEELKDKMQGKVRTYYAGNWLIIAIVCWVFICVF